MPILEYLFERGIDINILSKLKRTPLTKACYLNHVEIVKWLTSRAGIDILLQDVKGRSALHNAAWGSSGGKDVHTLYLFFRVRREETQYSLIVRNQLYVYWL